MVFYLKHCGISQPCEVYKVKVPSDVNIKIPFFKGLYVWYLPLCRNKNCKKKKRAVYYALDGWNNWHQLQDVPKNQIDTVIKAAKKIKKVIFKRFYRRLSKSTIVDKRIYLHASEYGRKVKCYGSRLGLLPTPDENLR